MRYSQVRIKAQNAIETKIDDVLTEVDFWVQVWTQAIC